jgi:hypothetical protein
LAVSSRRAAIRAVVRSACAAGSAVDRAPWLMDVDDGVVDVDLIVGLL